jgi:hypothetical protein
VAGRRWTRTVQCAFERGEIGGAEWEVGDAEPHERRSRPSHARCAVMPTSMLVTADPA